MKFFLSRSSDSDVQFGMSQISHPVRKDQLVLRQSLDRVMQLL